MRLSTAVERTVYDDLVDDALREEQLLQAARDSVVRENVARTADDAAKFFAGSMQWTPEQTALFKHKLEAQFRGQRASETEVMDYARDLCSLEIFQMRKGVL